MWHKTIFLKKILVLKWDSWTVLIVYLTLLPSENGEYTSTLDKGCLLPTFARVCSTELGNLGYKNFWNFEMSTYVYLYIGILTRIIWSKSDMLPIPMKLPPKTFWFRITYIPNSARNEKKIGGSTIGNVTYLSTWTRWFGSIYVGHIYLLSVSMDVH